MKRLIWILLFCAAFLQTALALDTIYKAEVTFTGVPGDGDTVTVNGVTWTFKVTVTDETTQVLIGATAGDTAANYGNSILTYPYASIGSQVAGTKVTLTGSANFVITASKTGSWGTVTVGTTTLSDQPVIVPLASNDDPVAVANAIVFGLSFYPTSVFPAGTAILQNFVDKSTSQTLSGDKSFTGKTTISNANNVIYGGFATNVALRKVSMKFDNANPNGLQTFDSGGSRTVIYAPDANGILTMYSGTSSEVPSTTWPTSSANSDGTILWRKAGDGRYGRLDFANTWTAQNTFNGLTRVENLQGIISNASGWFTNITTTNINILGLINVTNSAPAMLFSDSNGDVDEKNTLIDMNGGTFSIETINDAGTLQDFVMTAVRNGYQTVTVDFPSGEVRVLNLSAIGTFRSYASGHIKTFLGVGATNISAPTGLTSGLLMTNTTSSASADPVNSAAFWVINGEAKYRASGSGEGAGQNNHLHNRGAQVGGSGSDYALTTSYAQVTFGSSIVMNLPSDGTYLITGRVAVDEGAADYDQVFVKLYDATTAADVATTERSISNIPNGKRGEITLNTILTITAAHTIHLYAKNATAARGTIDSDETKLTYVRLY